MKKLLIGLILIMTGSMGVNADYTIEFPEPKMTVALRDYLFQEMYVIVGSYTDNIPLATGFGGDYKFCEFMGGELISSIPIAPTVIRDIAIIDSGNNLMEFTNNDYNYEYFSITCNIIESVPIEEEENGFFGVVDDMIGGSFTGVNTLLAGNFGKISIFILTFLVLFLIITKTKRVLNGGRFFYKD